jgi:mono/diheme cytochrome c family protein
VRAKFIVRVIVSTAVIDALQISSVMTQSIATPKVAVYTESQALRGAGAYAEACASCHGNQLEGVNFAPALGGEAFKTRWAGESLEDLFIVVKSTMPADSPNTLEPQQYVDIVAYLLRANGLPAGRDELLADPLALRQIVLPKQ